MKTEYILVGVGAVAVIAYVLTRPKKSPCPPGGNGTKECPEEWRCDVMTAQVPCRDLDYSKPTYYRCAGTNDVGVDYPCRMGTI